MSLPSIGFGTSPFRAGVAPIDVEQPVRTALATGYRLFDTAEAYGNESIVGRALRGAGAPPRRELHIIGKAWPTSFALAHLRRACESSLHRLGIDAFDVYLLHSHDAWRHIAPLDDAATIGWDELVRRGTSPIANDVPLCETWEAMQGLLSAGLTAKIGVSNFTPEQIGSMAPFANEIPCWPFDRSVIDWHAQHGIAVIGYSPLNRQIIQASAQIARTNRRTPAEVALRALIQSGIQPITFSTNPDHIRENFGALNFELEPADARRLTPDASHGPEFA